MRCTKDMENEKIKSKKTIRKGSKNVKKQGVVFVWKIKRCV